jgi:putative oxidoreductase
MKMIISKKAGNYAPIFLRMVFALYLYLALKAGVYTSVAHDKFASNLAGLGLPASSLLAYISTWSMLIAYTLISIGWFTRLAAIPVVINFIVALVWGHLLTGHEISKAISAIVLLVLGIFFLLNGPGKPSVDEGL